MNEKNIISIIDVGNNNKAATPLFLDNSNTKFWIFEAFFLSRFPVGSSKNAKSHLQYFQNLCRRTKLP